MELHEAIIHARETAGRCGEGSMCAHDHEQLADWPEELQQYKDTGLEPDRICEFMEKWVKVVELAGLMKQEGIEHLRELVRAEKDSRLVVLPCKVGDTVWAYRTSWWPEDGIVPYQITNITVTRNKRGVWTKKYRAMLLCNEKTCDWALDFSFDDLGKTVFLTLEEAERALEGGGTDA